MTQRNLIPAIPNPTLRHPVATRMACCRTWWTIEDRPGIWWVSGCSTGVLAYAGEGGKAIRFIRAEYVEAEVLQAISPKNPT